MKLDLGQTEYFLIRGIQYNRCLIKCATRVLTGADPEKYSLGGKRVAWRLEGVEEMEI